MSITNSKHKFNFHQPSSNLPLHKKGAHSTDIQIYKSPTEYQKCK
jgi:hypothetical protein